jgi:hypothetical protein
MKVEGIFLIALLLLSTTACSQRSFGILKEYDGKIGIGTSTPDEMLTVKGTIHTQEVVVDMKGAVAPDYVFQHYYEGTSLLKDDYKLMNLSELEQFLRAHHHLPDLPSAEELDSEGLELKKMNLLLLQKIEELTLYTIEQQKEIDLLKEKMTQLEN